MALLTLEKENSGKISEPRPLCRVPGICWRDPAAIPALGRLQGFQGFQFGNGVANSCSSLAGTPWKSGKNSMDFLEPGGRWRFSPPGWMFQDLGERIHPGVPQELGHPKGRVGNWVWISRVVSGWDFGGFCGRRECFPYLGAREGREGRAVPPSLPCLGLLWVPAALEHSGNHIPESGRRSRSGRSRDGRETREQSGDKSAGAVFHDFKFPGFVDLKLQTGFHQPPGKFTWKLHLERDSGNFPLGQKPGHSQGNNFKKSGNILGMIIQSWNFGAWKGF